MSNEERVEYRRQVVAEYQASGMTQKAFCREHGVALSTLGYWLKRERESQDAAATLVQIRPEPGKTVLKRLRNNAAFPTTEIAESRLQLLDYWRDTYPIYERFG